MKNIPLWTICDNRCTSNPNRTRMRSSFSSFCSLLVAPVFLASSLSPQTRLLHFQATQILLSIFVAIVLVQTFITPHLYYSKSFSHRIILGFTHLLQDLVNISFTTYMPGTVQDIFRISFVPHTTI